MTTEHSTVGVPPHESADGAKAATRTPRSFLIVGAVALALAVIGLGAGVYGIIDAHNAKAGVQDLRAQVSGLHSELAGALRGQAVLTTKLGSVSSQLSAVPGQAALAGVQSQLTKDQLQLASFANCIPELQTELSGLGINYSIYNPNASSDYITISNPNQISRDCSAVLFGGTDGG
jgi:hypothetical protein